MTDAGTLEALAAPYNPVEHAARLAWKPADMRPPWQWAEDNYTPPVSSIPGKWRSDNSPWVRQLTQDFSDNSIRQITVLCSAQSAKTETMLLLLCWIIAEDPSPTMWVTANEGEALKFCNERLMPALRLCPPVAKQIPNDRTQAKSMEILFPTMMLEAVGANAQNNLQGRSRRFLLLDEVRNWPSWSLPMVLKRTRTWWNSRTVILTTPNAINDTVHRQFLEGSQHHYHIPCLNPQCGVLAAMEWENMKAEHPETHRCVRWKEIPGARSLEGKWNYEVLAPQIRYVCPTCGHMHRDHPQVRYRMANEGEWRSHNPGAPAHLRSYTWSAMLPAWVKWRTLVEEYTMALSSLEFGNHEPLKAFITESLGKPWDDAMRFAKSEGYIDERCEDYDPRAKWDREIRRFMTVDVQGKGGRHFYYVVRAFAAGGDSRLISYGKAYSVEELRSIALDNNVQPHNVGIDTGAFTTEIYNYIMESGVLPNGDYAWKAMKGDKAAYYSSPDGAGVRVPFTFSFVDPYLGSTTGKANSVRPIRQVLFSKSSLLDLQEAYMRGSTRTKWSIPKNDTELHEYKMQVTAYDRVEIPKGNGEMEVQWRQKRADDHWGSCERMALVAAFAVGILTVKP